MDKNITLRRYLILRTLKYYSTGNYTVYWLRNQMVKQGLSIHERVLRRIIVNMLHENLVILKEGNKMRKKKNNIRKSNIKFISITEKGIKEFNDLHLKMRLLLTRIE